MTAADERGGILARLERAPLTVLFVLALLVWLPGFFTIPPLDRDESRFAQASKQMLETGDFVSIHLGLQERDQKPIGIYWLQSASTAVFNVFVPEGDKGREIWTYRVPSLLGAFAAVAFTFLLVRRFADLPAAMVAALLLAFTVLLFSEAKIAKTDAVLLATVVGAQSVLFRVYLSARSPATAAKPPLAHVLLGWGAFAFGILVKGPVIVFVSGATIIALTLWDREWRWLKGLCAGRGLLLVLAIVLPWAVAIGIATNGAFYAKSLGQDFAMKLVGGQEAHGAPPGYFTLLAPLTFWPATLALVPGLVTGVRRWREPAIRFLLAWGATTWLMFEIAPSKLPHYVLPAYPVLAILGALWLTAPRRAETRWDRMALNASVALFGLVGFAFSVAMLWASRRYGLGPTPALYVCVGLGALGVFTAALMMLRDWRIEAAGFAALSALVLYAAGGLGVAPTLDALWLSPRLAQAVARHRQPADPPIAIAGYSEPSAMFLLGTETTFLSSGAGAGLAAAPGGLAIVERNEQASFLGALQQQAARAEPLEEIDGLDYSNGRSMRLILYRVVPSR